MCEECEHELMTLTGRRHRQSPKKKRRKDVGVFSVVATAAAASDSDSAVKVVPFLSVLAPLPFFHSFSPDRP